MAIPKAKFLGLSSADPDRYGLLRNVGIKLSVATFHPRGRYDARERAALRPTRRNPDEPAGRTIAHD